MIRFWVTALGTECCISGTIIISGTMSTNEF
jgi:hypothetical protein